jgi:ABC-type uncharacterized transport system permease subunit
MIRYLLAAALVALAAPAFAQNQSGPFFTNAPVGQTPGGIQTNVFAQNTPPVGFANNSLATGVVAAGTTQGTATLIVAQTTVITTCPGSAGVELPSLERYVAITVINRSGGSCLVYPSPGATVETALGTNGATNAAFTQLTNTDVTYKPVSATQWLQ